MSCANCGSTQITGVQYCGTPEDWDGVSEWHCEPRYGIRRKPVKS